MVSVSTYSALWAYMKTVVHGIDEVLLLHEEADLASIIRDVAHGKVILLAIIPSSDMEASGVDDYEEIDSCFVFIVQKSDPGMITHQQFLDEMGATQVIIKALKKKMIDLAGDSDHCHASGTYGHLMHRLIINGMHTDPEYNLLGCNGWGLSFKLKTTGI